MWARQHASNAATPWYQQQTWVYLYAAFAYEVLHVPLATFLRWPAGERRMARAYLMAKHFREQAQAHERELAARHETFAAQWKGR